MKNVISESEKEIVAYLKDKYDPKVILLAGSRATGSASDDSDWDIFVFAEKEYRGGFFQWEGHLLDVTFRSWPISKNEPLTIPYGPLLPVKVLFDSSKGLLQAVLKKTQTILDQGPLKAYPDGCAARLSKLDRWDTKIAKFADDQNVQFYYAGFAIEFLIRVWFEQQNLWPLTPAQGFPFIKKHDRSFWNMLSKFVRSSGNERVEVYRKMLKKLHQIQPHVSK